MDKDYYYQYYNLERRHWWFRVRNKIILSHIESLIPTNQKLKILNIGVATGHTSELLQAFGDVTSVEYDKDCYEFVKNKLDLNLINGSILDLPFENESFDLVCAFDVIEHVEDDKLAVLEMKRVCKTGGHLCITVPAFMFLWSEHDEVNHHFRRYKIPELTSIFADKNKITYVSYFNFFLFFPIAAVRLIKSIFKSEKRDHGRSSDFEKLDNSIASKLFYLIFKSEIPFLKKRMRFPFGISILLSYRNDHS